MKHKNVLHVCRRNNKTTAIKKTERERKSIDKKAKQATKEKREKIPCIVWCTYNSDLSKAKF